MPGLAEYQARMLPEFNQALIKYIDCIFPNRNSELSEIFNYHLGLNDDLNAQGKRIRPMLTLMCTTGAGGDWRQALPAAAAIELIHNFSLIHDDIEDNGKLRRGKDAVWIQWGLAKGLNAGDVMFSTAFRVIKRLSEFLSAGKALQAVNLLTETCLRLTVGQQEDIGFQNNVNISSKQYIEMIEGKTAALIAAACQMGPIAAGKDQQTQLGYHDFGHSLGISFQIYDDWLGVWGDEKQTGKTTSGDLVEGKKSLPVLMGLEQSPRFKQRWDEGPVRTDETAQLAAWLREDGVEEKVKGTYAKWTNDALGKLASMACSQEIKLALVEIANKLIIRKR